MVSLLKSPAWAAAQINRDVFWFSSQSIILLVVTADPQVQPPGVLVAALRRRNKSEPAQCLPGEKLPRSPKNTTVQAACGARSCTAERRLGRPARCLPQHATVRPQLVLSSFFVQGWVRGWSGPRTTAPRRGLPDVSAVPARDLCLHSPGRRSPARVVRRTHRDPGVASLGGRAPELRATGLRPPAGAKQADLVIERKVTPWTCSGSTTA